MAAPFEPPRSRSTHRVAALVAGAMLVALAGGTLLATSAVLGPLLQPQPTLDPDEIAAALRSPSPGPIGPASEPPPSSTPSATPAPTPTPKPKAFSIDLYRKGDFVGEKKAVWCLSAAMQTSINIMTSGADRTYATQQRLFSLSRSLAPAPDGAAEPEGWAQGLTTLGFGAYRVSVHGSTKAAIKVAARQLRKTNRPVGLMVWRGAHSWVMSGFTATADPALTADFKVTAVRIEDVWYPRVSRIWGHSRPPDALVPVGKLGEDFLPWKRPQKRYPDKDGRFVIVVPTR